MLTEQEFAKQELPRLRRISSARYVEALLGEPNTQAFMAQFAKCPFHEDDKPVMQVFHDNARWFCPECQEGGNLLEFVAKRQGRAVPAGGYEFLEFVAEVASVI